MYVHIRIYIPSVNMYNRCACIRTHVEYLHVYVHTYIRTYLGLTVYTLTHVLYTYIIIMYVHTYVCTVSKMWISQIRHTYWLAVLKQTHSASMHI